MEGIINQHNFEEKKQLLTYLFIAIIILIFVVNYIFYNHIFLPNTYLTTSVILTMIIPIIANLYSLIYHIYFDKTHTSFKTLYELRSEKALQKQSQIPYILFGLGLFIIELEQKYISIVFPYLIYSLLFGTILVEILNYFTFDGGNLNRLIIIQGFDFAFISISYGFLIMGMYLTMSFYSKKKNNIL